MLDNDRPAVGSKNVFLRRAGLWTISIGLFLLILDRSQLDALVAANVAGLLLSSGGACIRTIARALRGSTIGDEKLHRRKTADNDS